MGGMGERERVREGAEGRRAAWGERVMGRVRGRARGVERAREE